VGLLFEQLRRSADAGRPVALATIVEGSGVTRKLLVRPHEPALGDLGDPELNRVVRRDALGALDAGRNGLRHYGPRGEARGSEVSVFIETFAPPARMWIFGAVDFSASLVSVAKVLGFHVVVCDPRSIFATRERFPDADEIVPDWPHELIERSGHRLGSRDAICILTHDPKFDVPAVIAALRTRAGYVGCMGSRRTHDDRMKRLLEAGVPQRELDRLMSPIGLDLGARTPAETAISICAEIIALRAGQAAPSLRDQSGPIHCRPPEDPDA